MTPSRILVLSFLGLIALGALLIMLPLSASEGHRIGLVDAIFMSTSAVCVTGLATVDLARDFSRPGQVIILALIQLGGLGISLFSTSLLLLLGGRLGLRGRVVMQQHHPGLSLSETAWLTRHITVFVLGCEAVGAVLLWGLWAGRLGAGEALYHGIFHSVSAFCNAGFSTFSDSLVREAGNLPLNLVVMGLILLGGFGYLVCSEVYGNARRGRGRLSLHTYVVLLSSLVLVVAGAALVLLFENANPRTLGSLGWPERLLASLFQSVTCRTAGFNTLNIGELHEETLQLMMLLMFVGGSPGSTAGGIKNTTFWVLLLAVWAQLRGRDDVEARERRIPQTRVMQALALTVIAAAAVVLVTLVLNYMEPYFYSQVLFEVVSALGTVGLSTGITAGLTVPSKLVLCLAMFAGRVGPMTLAASLISTGHRNAARYPAAEIVIG